MTEAAASPDSTLLPRGFTFSAVQAGIKASGRLDLAMAEATPDTTAAALFTKNLVVAAPITVGRKHLAASRGLLRALIVNSGNANCATGPEGIRRCKQTCKDAARLLGVRRECIVPSSTGIIGVPLPVDRILAHLPELVEARESSNQALSRFAQSIMTTDTRPKVASARFPAGRTKEVRLLGVAKGSGMIHPQLATMLVYLFTDAVADPSQLNHLLRHACDETFNCISVDGDTSTNDTVLLMASGVSRVALADRKVNKKFAAALRDVCRSLAAQIVSDGEGAQHIIRLRIEQAANRTEALQVARAIAHSLLVKTAWAGADPNWGRILAAVGYSGVSVRPDRITIFIGDQEVCRNGTTFPFDEGQAHRDLDQPSCTIRVKLGRGKAGVLFTTTDLTAEYVRINADYST
jgi:glutamate N-acetyltransferase/amino-acid N-acetyltransferase